MKDAKYYRKLESSIIGALRLPNCLLCYKEDASLAAWRTFEQADSDIVMHHVTPYSSGGSIKNGGVVAPICTACHIAAHTVNGRFSWSHVNEGIAKLLTERAAEYQGPKLAKIRARHNITV